MGLNKANRTLWDRRFRSNVESDLNVFNNRNIQIVSPPPNIGSISFILEKKANLGRLFTKGATTLDISEITPLPLDQKRSIVLTNGRIYLSSVDISALVKDFTVVGNFIIGNGGSNNEDFNISHLTFYGDSRILTQQEIYEIHVNGGIAPESTHDIIIEGNLSLTERYAFKADAAFIVKHPQFIVGDNVFFDTVEQYNYAKELITREDFATSLGDFIQTGIGTVTASGGEAVLTQGTPTFNLNISMQTPVRPLTIGKSYKIIVNYDGTGLITNDIRIRALNQPVNEVIVKGSVGVFETTFIATSDTTFFIIGTALGTVVSQTLGEILKFDFVIFAETVLLEGANHARAVNFTDAELGITNPSTQTAKKDFYGGDTLKKGAFFFNRRVATQYALGAADAKLVFDNSYTAEIDLHIPSVGGVTDGSMFALQRAVGVGSAFIFSYNRGTDQLSVLFYDLGGLISLNAADILTTKGLFDRSIKLHLVYDKAGNTAKFYVNGVEEVSTVTTGMEALNTTRVIIGNNLQNPNLSFEGFISSATIFFDKMTQAQINDRIEDKFVNITKIFETSLAEVEGAIMYDLTANPTDLTLVNFLTEELIPGGLWRDKSLFPQLIEALQVQTAAPQIDVRVDNFTPGNAKGYTFIHVLAEDNNAPVGGDAFFLNSISAVGNFYFQRDSDSRQYGAGIDGSTKGDAAPNKLNSINVLAVQYNPTPSDLGVSYTIRITMNGNEIGSFLGGLAMDYATATDSLQIGVNRIGTNNWPNASWIADLAWSRVLSNKEIQQIAANILSKNSVGNIDKTDALFYYQRNLGSFYDDGAFVRITNLMGTEEDAFIEGLVGATSALKLLDVPNHLIDIDDLK